MVIFLPIYQIRADEKRQAIGCCLRREPGIMMRYLVALGIFCCSLFLADAVSAGIYKYEDENGVLHFTNCPKDPKFKLYLREPDEEARPTMRRVSYGYIKDSTIFDHLIAESAETHQVDFALIKAIIRAESGFNPYAISRKGARGLMQLMPETASRMSVPNIFSPRDNIEGGVRYFRYLLYLFNNDLRLSLAAYNAGENIVAQLGTIPPYRETVDYVQKVLDFYQQYRQ